MLWQRVKKTGQSRLNISYYTHAVCLRFLTGSEGRCVFWDNDLAAKSCVNMPLFVSQTLNYRKAEERLRYLLSSERPCHR